MFLRGPSQPLRVAQKHSRRCIFADEVQRGFQGSKAGDLGTNIPVVMEPNSKAAKFRGKTLRGRDLLAKKKKIRL